MKTFQFEEPFFNESCIVQENYLTISQREDFNGVLNFQIDLSSLGNNSYLSSNEYIQNKNRLFRAKLILQAGLEVIAKAERELEEANF